MLEEVFIFILIVLEEFCSWVFVYVGFYSGFLIVIIHIFFHRCRCLCGFFCFDELLLNYNQLVRFIKYVVGYLMCSGDFGVGFCEIDDVCQVVVERR